MTILERGSSKTPPVGGVKHAGPGDHLRFDFHRHQFLEVGIAEQEMGRHPGALADNGGAVSLGRMRERHQRYQRLGRCIMS